MDKNNQILTKALVSPTYYFIWSQVISQLPRDKEISQVLGVHLKEQGRPSSPWDWLDTDGIRASKVLGRLDAKEAASTALKSFAKCQVHASWSESGLGGRVPCHPHAQMKGCS